MLKRNVVQHFLSLFIFLLKYFLKKTIFLLLNLRYRAGTSFENINHFTFFYDLNFFLKFVPSRHQKNIINIKQNQFFVVISKLCASYLRFGITVRLADRGSVIVLISCNDCQEANLVFKYLINKILNSCALEVEKKTALKGYQ